MSKTISGFLTAIAWGKETSQGTAAGSSPYLWNSQESDGLSFGETPLNTKPIAGVRGQNSASYRVGQNLPGGNLGAIPMHFGTDATEMLILLESHFQKFTQSGTAAPYTYTFTPADEAIEDGSFTTLTFTKEVGEASHAHQYVGCILDEIEISWESNGAIMLTPGSVKAMSSSNDATMPTIPAVPTAGFMQAPNIAVTWGGTTLYPDKWKLNSKTMTPDKQSGSARGRQAYAVGDYEGSLEMDIWRNDDVDTLLVSPFYDGDVNTLVIAATMDTDYGLIGSTAVTMTITAECMISMPNDLPTGKDDLIDTVKFLVVNDTPITVAINATTGSLI